MRTILLLLMAAALALPVAAQDGPCVDGIMQCSDGTWSTCYWGCPVKMNCPGDCGCPGNPCSDGDALTASIAESMKLKTLADQIAQRLAQYQVSVITRKLKLLADDSPQIIVPTDCPGGPGCPGGNPNDPPQPCYQGSDPMVQCPTGIIGSRG